jgi:23S rRNA pseudouridine2605 synthase
MKKNKAEVEEKYIRLNKLIANSGLCSRREADEYIKAGLISVNGKIVTKLGTKVKIDDDIRYNNQRIKPEKKVYILMNKPKGYVTTVKDKYACKTVLDLLQHRVKERVYPVGRLDKDTTGVLLLTNDGDVAKKLTHPKYMKKKIYHVVLDKNLSYPHLEQIGSGVELDDEIIEVDAIEYVDVNDKKQIGIEIHTGQNHVIKRIFEKYGYKVKKLDRVYYGGFTKKNLPRGKWRFLTNNEINMLKMGAYE